MRRPRFARTPFGADGVTHILMDMEEQAEYPCGYRNALYMTNFSKSERGKQNFVSTILGFQGDSAAFKGR